MKRAVLLGIVLMVTIGLAGLAQEGVGAFIGFRTGVDARALAMGGAFAAIADSYSATYWNPAGLAKAGGPRIGGMNTNKFGQGITFNFLSGTMTIANFAVGASFVNSSITGIERIDEEGNVVGTINDNELLLMGSVAMALPGLGYAGGSVKSYSHTLAEERANGLGFDAGVLFPGFIPILSVGAAAFDLGGTKITWTTGTVDVVSGFFKVGAAFTLAELGLTIAADFDFGEEESVLHLGGEFVIAGTPIAVRGGAVSSAPGEFEFTVGAGLKLGQLGVDFAFLQNRALGNSLVLSAEFVFAAPAAPPPGS